MALKLIADWASSVNSLTVFTILAGLLCLAAFMFHERRKFIDRVNKVPGFPGGMPLIGNTAMIVVPPDEVFNRIMGYVIANKCLAPVVRVWAGPYPIFFLTTPQAFEIVLGSNKLIDKSREYDFLHPWLNTGLLTSTGTKWFTRRKLLTPTFHFKILEDFLQVFNEQSQVLVNQLSNVADTECGFNVYPYITRCTLDIICETAMGCCIKAQTEEETDYVRAIYSMSHIIQTRQARPWLQPNILFRLSSFAAKERENLKILHGFTMDVIKRRKAEHKVKGTNDPIPEKLPSQDDYVETKRRLAFLDLLIEASQDGKVLSDTDIREEVDTFMFEGHDTTTAAINWSLLLIGSHPHVQEQVNAELQKVFGDSERPITMSDLTELKYLESCIKEALRLYPSVPIMGRCLSEDTAIHGYTLPAKTTVLLLTYLLHRDPEHFPDPDLFKPERFFPENSRGRHPYAYVPFSAGARNCIGQKFALMEEKVILASILRNFRVTAIDKREELILLGELILRPRDGVHLRLARRNN